MFGFIGKILETTVKIAVLPVSVAADVVTGCGLATDEKEPYTIKAVKDIANTIDEIGD
jgi:hypothetical protein